MTCVTSTLSNPAVPVSEMWLASSDRYTLSLRWSMFLQTPSELRRIFGRINNNGIDDDVNGDNGYDDNYSTELHFLSLVIIGAH